LSENDQIRATSHPRIDQPKNRLVKKIGPEFRWYRELAVMNGRKYRKIRKRQNNAAKT
jgi:hypothetical protein